MFGEIKVWEKMWNWQKVKIDETKIFRWKYNEVRIVGLSWWLVGGIERKDNWKIFLILVPDIKTGTFFKAICDSIESVTRIISDM